MTNIPKITVTEFKTSHSNFAEVKDNGVRIRHLSTSSIIELFFEDEEHGDRAIYIEYNELDSLVKCIEKLKTI